MKFYIKSTTEKPVLDNVIVIWRELYDETGIVFSILSEYHELLFEELFDYDDVDSDAIYDSAIDMAIFALSQKYNLTEDAIPEINNSKESFN